MSGSRKRVRRGSFGGPPQPPASIEEAAAAAAGEGEAMQLARKKAEMQFQLLLQGGSFG